MTKDIRVGVIGVGWGSLVLAPAFNVVRGFEVVALCSQREERVRAAGEKLGIADVTTDWRALVERDDLDLIAICTPTPLHHEQAIAAMRAGKHVLCEKPVAQDPDEAREMYEVAEETGAVNGVNFEGRWLRERLPVWEMVRDGYIGDPYLARVVTSADYWHPTRTLQSEWMYDRDAGGGYLLGLASHDVDFLSALFGEPVAVCADVQTSLSTRTRADGSTLNVTADDTSNVIMRMAGGGSCLISTTMMAPGVDSRVLEIYGSKGTIIVEGQVQGGPTTTFVKAGQVGEDLHQVELSRRMPDSDVEIPQRRSGEAVRALSLMLEDWLPAFEGKPTDVPDLKQGWRVAQVVDAARRSSDGAGWVTLDQ
ncbi:MAG: putative Myo-inositol 2-dehydrogenase [Pseudonocardiales bacterium]|nr:putative Myo-inositol 2-dehydrogenase [Pseudonocardiales bacterium]